MKSYWDQEPLSYAYTATQTSYSRAGGNTIPCKPHWLASMLTLPRSHAPFFSPRGFTVTTVRRYRRDFVDLRLDIKGFDFASTHEALFALL